MIRATCTKAMTVGVRWCTAGRQWYDALQWTAFWPFLSFRFRGETSLWRGGSQRAVIRLTWNLAGVLLKQCLYVFASNLHILVCPEDTRKADERKDCTLCKYCSNSLLTQKYWNPWHYFRIWGVLRSLAFIVVRSGSSCVPDKCFW